MVMLKLEDQPPLIQAIFSGEIDDVRNLLDTKLDVNYQDAEKRSPLHAAAFKGDKELAELLLAQGARVNTKDCKWLTPLHRACGVGSEDTVALLLSHNADTTARDRQWQTPLHIAAANNAVECVSHLLHYVPNVNVTDRSGRTALHHAALNGHNDVVELLISKGCIVNACDKKDCRPIHWAAHLGHVDTMELLMRNGADIHVKDRNQYTPLHVAAASGMLYACRLLLHAGADVDAQNSFGNTPLHIACLNGHLPVCQELAMYTANLEAVNYRGQTPLHIAAASTQGVACLTYLLDQNVNINTQSLDGRTALHMSAIHGRFTRSKTLIDKGAIVDSQDKNGNTALHIAAQYGHDILTTTLLDYGADPNKRGYEGRTPLHSCCLSGFVEVSRKFIQIKVDLNTADDTGKTAVHCAAYKGSVECLDLLVSQGANFKLQDIYGRTPLHYSATQGHYTCVFTLVGIGATVNIVDNEGCTPLHLAAAYDLEGRCVEYLLQHKADPKMKDGRGYTPVHYAVNGSNSNSLGHLLEAAGKNYNFQEEGMPLNTPLHLAARRGDIKILNSVISYFPDVNIKNDTGCTPLLIAAREGHTHSVQMLLRYGAKVGICEDVYNMSPVHYSAKNGHMHCLALLVDNTEDKNIIDKPDKFNRTALMLAISGSHINCVLTLLKSEANPNIVDSDRHSSLFRAVVTNQNNVVQYLISKGAYVSEPDINGKTVLHLASACGHFVCLQTIMLYIPVEKAASLDNHDFSALHWGCYHGFYTCVEYLLQKGVFKKIEGNPFSPVHCATFVGSERCLELLYNAFGAEIVKLIDSRKRTPLHIAALHGHTDCARYLLEQGAEIESKDEFGRTALIAASQNGQSQMLELLIAYKANVKSCDNNGNTALHMACLKKHSHTALLLLEYINDIDTINMVNNDKKTPLHLSARNGLVEVTRNLIKKGSSVLAVDSNGLTPALCCAPNPSVAQCLAIILANHPMQFPVVNHSTKAEDQQLFQKLVANLTLPNVTFRTSLIQTDMSLQRDPCELFDAIVQKIKPDYIKKALKPHRKKAHVVYSSPSLHKTHRTKPEIILIEKYGKNDGFDDSFKEVKGLSLHRSFSEIALVPTSIGNLNKESVQNSTLDLKCNRIENLELVQNLKFNDDVMLKRVNLKQKLNFHKTNKDFDLILSDYNKNCNNTIKKDNSKEIHLNSLNKGIENIHCRDPCSKNTILKPPSLNFNKNFSGTKVDLNSINIRMAELTEFHGNIQKDVITVANCSIPQKDSNSNNDQPSTSSQSSPLPNSPRVNHNDAFKPVTKKLKTAASDNSTEKMRCQGDVGLLQENKAEQLFSSSRSSTRMRKKLCTCQYVCEKCVLRNSFDEFETNSMDELVAVMDGNQEDQRNRDADYQLHRVTTTKLGINDMDLEKDPEKQLTPAELAAFLRDEPETSNTLGAFKKPINQIKNSMEKISTACGSTSDIWPKVTLDSDRIIMPSDLEQASTTLVQTVESKTSNFSPAISVQLLCDNFEEKKTPSLSNRMSLDSLDEIDRYPDRDINKGGNESQRNFIKTDKMYLKQGHGSIKSNLIEIRKCTNQCQRKWELVDLNNESINQKSHCYSGTLSYHKSEECVVSENENREKHVILDNKDSLCKYEDLNTLNEPDNEDPQHQNYFDEDRRIVDQLFLKNTSSAKNAQCTSMIDFLPGEYSELTEIAEKEHRGLIFEELDEEINSNSIVTQSAENFIGNDFISKPSTSLESLLIFENKMEPTMTNNTESTLIVGHDSGIIKSSSLEDDEDKSFSLINEITDMFDSSSILKNDKSIPNQTIEVKSSMLKNCEDVTNLSNFESSTKLKEGIVGEQTALKPSKSNINDDTFEFFQSDLVISPLEISNTNDALSSSNLKETANMEMNPVRLTNCNECNEVKNSNELSKNNVTTVTNVIKPLKHEESTRTTSQLTSNNVENIKEINTIISQSDPEKYDGLEHSSILREGNHISSMTNTTHETVNRDDLDINAVNSQNIKVKITSEINLPEAVNREEDKEIQDCTLQNNKILKSNNTGSSSKLKKENSCTTLNNIGKKMENHFKESSSLLDRIIKTMERGIEETNTAAIMDSIDGIKQLMMHSNITLEDVCKTIECGRYKESISYLNESRHLEESKHKCLPLNSFFSTVQFDDNKSIRFSNSSFSPQTAGQIDVPSFHQLESSLNLQTTRLTNECITPSNLQILRKSNGKLSNLGNSPCGADSSGVNIYTALDNELTEACPILNDEALEDLPSSNKIQNFLSPTIFKESIRPENSPRPSSPTGLILSTCKLKPQDLCNFTLTGLNDGCMNQISIKGDEVKLSNPLQSLFNISSTEINDKPANSLDDFTPLENTNSGNDDIKSFRNLAHSETRRSDNLESIIIDNAVVSSSIDPTHVLGRCTIDTEYFDIMGPLESNSRFNYPMLQESETTKHQEETRESLNNLLLKHKSFDETNSVTGSINSSETQHSPLLQEFIEESNIFEDGIGSEDEAFEGRRSQTPEIGDVSVSSRRYNKQEEKMTRKSVSKGIKMRMKKNEEVQSSNSHESFLHRNSHYGVYAAHGSDFTREEDAHSQNSSDNEYY